MHYLPFTEKLKKTVSKYASFIFTIVVLFLYLIVFFYVSIFKPVEFSIYMAFMSMVATFISSFFPIFSNDKIYGSIVSLLIGIGVGYILANFYFIYFCNNGFILFDIDRIGNILTVLSMFLYFLGSLKTIILSFHNK